MFTEKLPFWSTADGRQASRVVLAGMLAAAVAAPSAYAANLSIDDTVENEITLCHDANWEGGVTSNGVPYSPYDPGCETAPGEYSDFSGAWIVNSPGRPDPGAGIIYITDYYDPSVVSDIIRADWETTGLARIRVDVLSSACGENLGPLPPGFQGIPEPDGSIGIQGSFLNPLGGNPVVIPSNLTMQFISKIEPDTDGDGVPDCVDLCPDTEIPEGVPTERLGTNRWALTDDDGIFDTTPPAGEGPGRYYTIQDTHGCSCEQIIYAAELGLGHTKFGCSISAMDDWIEYSVLP